MGLACALKACSSTEPLPEALPFFSMYLYVIQNDCWLMKDTRLLWVDQGPLSQFCIRLYRQLSSFKDKASWFFFSFTVAQYLACCPGRGRTRSHGPRLENYTVKKKIDINL